MRISDTTHLTIGEKFAQAAQEEYRKNETALTQASGIDMGLGREERDIDHSRAAVVASTDTMNLSETALSRYRAIAGDKTGDRESFTRKNYLQSQALEKQLKAAGEEAARARREELERLKSGEEAEAPDERTAAPKAKGPGLRGAIIDVRDSFGLAFGDIPGDEEDSADPAAEEKGAGHSLSGGLAGTDASGGAAARGASGASGQSETAAAVEQIRAQIAEVRQMLGEAQGRMAEAAAKAQQVASGAAASGGASSLTGEEGTEAAAARQTVSGSGSAAAPSAFDMGMSAEGVAAQAELAAAQVEVAEFAGRLQQLNQQLMQLQGAKE